MQHQKESRRKRLSFCWRHPKSSRILGRVLTMQTIPPDELVMMFEPILRRSDIRVVECKSRPRRGELFVRLVIHKPGGISLDDCTEVYKNIYPQLEISQHNREVHLEVSSPGIDRNFKSAHEFQVFDGEGVRILEFEQSEWIEGTIHQASDSSIVLGMVEEERKIEYEVIQKAKLDSSAGGY